jgi:tRNA 2-thiouridine synthesizing protein E
MPTIATAGRIFEIDETGFLLDSTTWHDSYATAMAASCDIPGELTDDHWKVIHFIRDSFRETGQCPLVYQTCRANKLRLRDLNRLFPSGYLRGACKLAGVTYIEGYIGNPWAWTQERPKPIDRAAIDKVYRVDSRGFLVDPDEWDETFARHRAEDMVLPGGLSETHWLMIRWVRDYHGTHGHVPTVYETCEEFGIGIDQLERRFPRGYHRGLVKLAGLRVR